MTDKPETIDELLRKRKEREQQEADQATSDLRDPNSPEPEWLRDNSATPVGGGIIFFEGATMEQLSAACEGESTACPICGEMHPIWPISGPAQHMLDRHKDEITLQMQQVFAMQCVPGLTQAVMGVMQQHLMSRVSLRRKVWQMGFFRIVEPNAGPKIQLPGTLPPRRPH